MTDCKSLASQLFNLLYFLQFKKIPKYLVLNTKGHHIEDMHSVLLFTGKRMKINKYIMSSNFQEKLILAYSLEISLSCFQYLLIERSHDLVL